MAVTSKGQVTMAGVVEHHQTLITMSTLIFAWFCVTWGIAGTTLRY